MLFLLQQAITPETTTVWDGIAQNLLRPAMAIRLGIVLFSMPIWVPIVRVMWRELRHSIDDKSDEFAPAHQSPESPPDSADSPFFTIPYAMYRKHGAEKAKAELERREQVAITTRERAIRGSAADSVRGGKRQGRTQARDRARRF